jgi:hypothetical protein
MMGTQCAENGVEAEYLFNIQMNLSVHKFLKTINMEITKICQWNIRQC